jgi:hypothetical protein
MNEIHVSARLGKITYQKVEKEEEIPFFELHVHAKEQDTEHKEQWPRAKETSAEIAEDGKGDKKEVQVGQEVAEFAEDDRIPEPKDGQRAIGEGKVGAEDRVIFYGQVEGDHPGWIEALHRGFIEGIGKKEEDGDRGKQIWD